MIFDVIFRPTNGEPGGYRNGWSLWTTKRDLEEAEAAVADLEAKGIEAGLVLVGFTRKRDPHGEF
jgi:hypothetical protein